MNDSRHSDYVAHIRRAAMEACEFVSGMDKSAFLADTRTQRAVVMNLIIIGEAATKLMERHAEFVEQRPQVPWRSMRGMRNRVAHGYFDINFEIVWDTVQTALPQLLLVLPDVHD